MKANAISKTAQGVAAARALESLGPEHSRLFEDRFARGLLPPVYRFGLDLLRVPGIGPTLLALRERQYPGVLGHLLCRTRCIDDALSAALKTGFEQVVILGAGYDSRAYRIPGIERTHVFEVDHPATQADKKSRLKQMLGTLPEYVTFVPIDFGQQKLEDVMTTAGFQADTKTFFIWEGVTQYIPAEAVDSTLRYVSQAAARSQIIFSYVLQSIFDGTSSIPKAQKFLASMEKIGEPWIFGLDPAEVAAYLAERGLTLVQQVGAADYQERYFKPIGRQLAVAEIERIAIAQVMG